MMNATYPQRHVPKVLREYTSKRLIHLIRFHHITIPITTHIPKKGEWERIEKYKGKELDKETNQRDT